MSGHKSIARWLRLAAIAICVNLLLPWAAHSHEIVGEVTPLMARMQRTLTFVENDRFNEAFRVTESIYQDFTIPARQGPEAGLKNTSARIDGRFGTTIAVVFETALKDRNPIRLQLGLRMLSYLLMVEKFDVLEMTFNNENINPSSQSTIFWLGRNYFSYILEPTMGIQTPIEEKRLDRLLDKMLYSVEDRDWDQFRGLRRDLNKGIIRFFRFPLDIDG